MPETNDSTGIYRAATKLVLAGALLAAPLTVAVTPAIAADPDPGTNAIDHEWDRHHFDRPWEHWREFVPVPEFVLPPTGSF